jgi:hypothetical protein
MPTHTPAEIVAILREEGIPCEPHELGLAEYAADPRAYARALKACQPTVLRVLTMEGDRGIDPAPPCTQDPYTCTCPVHDADRVASIRRGPRETSQPWEAQPSRRAA